MCCLEHLFKYTSLAILTYVFQEFQVIHNLLNTLLIQLQNHSKLYITKQNPKHYCYAWVITQGKAVWHLK